MYRFPINRSPVDSSQMPGKQNSQSACGSSSGMWNGNAVSDTSGHLRLSRQNVSHRVGFFREIAKFHHSRRQFLKSAQFRVCWDIRDDCFQGEILADFHGVQAPSCFGHPVFHSRNLDEIRQVGRDELAVKWEKSPLVFSRLSMLRPLWSHRDFRDREVPADGGALDRCLR